jgi:6-phosphogluconolactonase
MTPNIYSKTNDSYRKYTWIFGEEIRNQEAKRYGNLLTEKLPKELGLPQFDLVILGMGDDGHTASVFPHELNLWVSHNCEVAYTPILVKKTVTITGR